MMDYEFGGRVGPRPKPPLSEEDKGFNRRLRADIEAHQGKEAADAAFADSDAAAAIARALRAYVAVRDGTAAADAAFADDAIARETQAYIQSACKEAYAAANPPRPRKPASPSVARRRLREYLEDRDGKAATDAVFADYDAAAAISRVFRVYTGSSNGGTWRTRPMMKSVERHPARYSVRRMVSYDQEVLRKHGTGT